jgi:hypothetical protein
MEISHIGQYYVPHMIHCILKTSMFLMLP